MAVINNSNIIDKAEYINGVLVPSAVDMLKNINKDWLCSSKFYQFHGDFILDNIIYKKNGEFVLLDWRQDFGGDLKKWQKAVNAFQLRILIQLSKKDADADLAVKTKFAANFLEGKKSFSSLL